jgi:hypothetical protein
VTYTYNRECSCGSCRAYGQGEHVNTENFLADLDPPKYDVIERTTSSGRRTTMTKWWEKGAAEREYDEKRALINSLNRLLVRVEELEERVNRLERALEDDGR